MQIQMNDDSFDVGRAEDIVYQTINKETIAQKSQTIDANDAGKKIDLLVLNIANKEDTLNGDERSKVIEALRKEFNIKPDAEISINSVEPFIGKEILRNGINAIVWTTVLIILYVWIRFKAISGLSAGVMAVVALFHDVAMVLITYIIFKIPLNESFIASVLTILGYSINDTIVIYDRIRENTRTMRKMPIGQLVNMSILQSLSRSINTSVCVFLSVATLVVFSSIYNIPSIRDFAFPLMVGVVSGCYSTIFIAGPLWVMWKESQEKKKVAAKA